MEERLEISTPSSLSLNISTTADIPDIDFGALLDEHISYLSPALYVIKEGIAWLNANAADYLSALQLFVTSHPYISISIPVGLVLLIVYGPMVIGATLAFLLQLVTLPLQFLAKFFLLIAEIFQSFLQLLVNILGFKVSGVAGGTSGYAGDLYDDALIDLYTGSLAALYQSLVHGGYVVSNSVFAWAQALGAAIV